MPIRFHQAFQWLMIYHKNEWVSMQITHKMNYSPYYNKGIPFIEFHLDSSSLLEQLANDDESKLPSLIVHMCTHYYSKTQHVPIYIQLEWPSPNGSTQDWCKNQSSLQFFKITFFFFFQLPFLIHLCQLNP